MNTEKMTSEAPLHEELESVVNAEEITEETETMEKTETLEEVVADPLAELTAKCADLNDKNLRLMAEFDNYRKRTLKEKSDLIKTAGEAIFKDMLPLIDDFERAQEAMVQSQDIEAIREGITLIYNKFMNFLSQKGVTVISTEGDFDVEFHEAITTFPAPTEEQKGKIIDCTSKGYRLGEKVIRFSKVVVGE